ncbi:MAG: hypothetical protein HC799_03300 [Limnothrix sp. RL_2_0]|nr:hypothetical protein [Limnothrix sp. RL_2_0]
MSQPLVTVQPIIAQQATPPIAEENAGSGSTLWMVLTLVFFLSTVGMFGYGKMLTEKHEKALKLDQYKIRDLKKKLKLALTTIKKMETNPDLVHSRDFNLDYLRMRMEEGMFHGAIVNQMKIKIKQIISVALRPSTADTATVGIATSGRQVDEIFDLHYETDDGQGKHAKGVLFRVHVKLTKLPTQSSSSTVDQIIDCIETFLNPGEGHENWQPTVQGRVAILEWDQKAKPTPLLVLRQSEEGGNVSFRTQTARPPRPRSQSAMNRSGHEGGGNTKTRRNPSSSSQQQKRRPSGGQQHRSRSQRPPG